MSTSVARISICRICSSVHLVDVMSLGNIAVSDFPDETGDDTGYPLDLVFCDPQSGGCGLLQLRHTISPERLYRTYWYRSGMNNTMTRELEGIAHTAEKKARLSPGDIVIDIGANDGTLLRGYVTSGIQRVGFEPAKNLAHYNSIGTTTIVADFFSAHAFQEHYGSAKAQVITAIAMFYDLDKPNEFVSDLSECLAEDGICIIQMSYLPLMISQNAFDNICHEHLEYYSLTTFVRLLSAHGLVVFDAELNDANGGSFRVYIRHSTSKKVSQEVGADIRVSALVAYEDAHGYNGTAPYREFADRIDMIRQATRDLIRKKVSEGKTVYVYGASTKGNTLLQYYGLDKTLITAAAELNRDKWGKKTVKTGIPIISEEEARKNRPDYFLVLPWHFLDEFISREKQFLAEGGAFIVPLPELKIIDASYV